MNNLCSPRERKCLVTGVVARTSCSFDCTPFYSSSVHLLTLHNTLINVPNNRYTVVPSGRTSSNLGSSLQMLRANAGPASCETETRKYTRHVGTSLGIVMRLRIFNDFLTTMLRGLFRAVLPSFAADTVLRELFSEWREVDETTVYRMCPFCCDRFNTFLFLSSFGMGGGPFEKESV